MARQDNNEHGNGSVPRTRKHTHSQKHMHTQAQDEAVKYALRIITPA